MLICELIKKLQAINEKNPNLVITMADGKPIVGIYEFEHSVVLTDEPVDSDD